MALDWVSSFSYLTSLNFCVHTDFGKNADWTVYLHHQNPHGESLVQLETRWKAGVVAVMLQKSYCGITQSHREHLYLLLTDSHVDLSSVTIKGKEPFTCEGCTIFKLVTETHYDQDDGDDDTNRLTSAETLSMKPPGKFRWGYLWQGF